MVLGPERSLEKGKKGEARRNARWPHTSLRGSRYGFRNLHFGFVPSTQPSPQGAGRIQALRAVRRARLGADVLFGILSKTFFYKNHIFWNEFQDIHCIMTPEGTKPNATHQNP